MTPNTATPTSSVNVSMQNTLDAQARAKALPVRRSKRSAAKKAVKLPTPAEAKDQLFSSLRVLRKKSVECVNFSGKFADLGPEPHTPEILELVAEVRRFTDPQLSKLVSELEKSVLRAEKDAERLWRGTSYKKVFLTPKSEKQTTGWLVHVKGQLQRSKVEVETVAGITMPSEARENAERAIANAKKILFSLQNPTEDAKVRPEDLRFANVHAADKLKNGGQRRSRRTTRFAEDRPVKTPFVEAIALAEELKFAGHGDLLRDGVPVAMSRRQATRYSRH